MGVGLQMEIRDVSAWCDKRGTPVEPNQIQTHAVAQAGCRALTCNTNWYFIKKLEGSTGMFAKTFPCLGCWGLFVGEMGNSVYLVCECWLSILPMRLHSFPHCWSHSLMCECLNSLWASPSAKLPSAGLGHSTLTHTHTHTRIACNEYSWVVLLFALIVPCRSEASSPQSPTVPLGKMWECKNKWFGRP